MSAFSLEIFPSDALYLVAVCASRLNCLLNFLILFKETSFYLCSLYTVRHPHYLWHIRGKPCIFSTNFRTLLSAFWYSRSTNIRWMYIVALCTGKTKIFNTTHDSKNYIHVNDLASQIQIPTENKLTPKLGPRTEANRRSSKSIIKQLTYQVKTYNDPNTSANIHSANYGN